MPLNLQNSSNFWARIKGDTVAPGDGSANTTPLRYDQFNGDIGNAQTIVADDGSLSSITIGTTDPLANTSGAANVKWSALVLLRWLIAEVRRITTATLTVGGSFANPLPTTIPIAANAAITSAMTSATGTSFQAFGGNACYAMEIMNNTGTTIEYQRGGTGTAFPIVNGSARLILAITNTNQIGVRRTDQISTQVTVQAEYYS